MEIKSKEIFGNSGYFIDTHGNITKNGKKINPRAGGYKKRYLRVSIERRDFYIHRLVLDTFIGACPNGMQACHNDGNPLNNYLKNLRWDTAASNSADKKIHGTSGKGQLNAMAKISDIDAEIIVKVYSLVKTKDIADRFNIRTGTVIGIVSGKIRFNNSLTQIYLENKSVSEFRIKQARNNWNNRCK